MHLKAATTERRAIKRPPLLLFCILLLLSACSSTHPLATTPNVYLNIADYPAQEMMQAKQTTTPDIIYVTDRLAELNKKGDLVFGAKRSSAMVVGKVTVQYGDGTSWEDLIAASQTQKRKKKINLEILKTEILVKFPKTPLPFTEENGVATILEPGASLYAQKEAKFQTIMAQNLAQAKRKEVVLFIHGFNNDFRDAGLSLADMWHFTGRVGVPIFYTWPAASGGLFGYFKDRESGEFTIFHLKELLRMLSRTRGLERIHIIAHSRGTDIAVTALRELIIEARGAGIRPLEKYKVENLILAAPDLDFDIFRQRIVAENIGIAFGRITIYMNRNDSALGLSQFLMSGLRLGRLGNENLGVQESKVLGNVKNVNFIHVEGVSGFFGHDYYRSHPGVLSDIAVLIRERAAPGSKYRPLTHEAGPFWVLQKDYLLQK
ncbi:hypothetical protein MNBD_ALPHA02-2181 [hydrothermal vent metagenome]|uniref:Alpha/beta hydrolase n=1 Tax=hydrothermal vent metagenome TaxID=652676 RepID=A0A3B0RHT9_9ZZZZ